MASLQAFSNHEFLHANDAPLALAGGAYSAKVAAMAASKADLASRSFFSSDLVGPSAAFLASASAFSFAIRSFRSASS